MYRTNEFFCALHRTTNSDHVALGTEVTDFFHTFKLFINMKRNLYKFFKMPCNACTITIEQLTMVIVDIKNPTLTKYDFNLSLKSLRSMPKQKVIEILLTSIYNCSQKLQQLIETKFLDPLIKRSMKQFIDAFNYNVKNISINTDLLNTSQIKNNTDFNLLTGEICFQNSNIRQ